MCPQRRRPAHVGPPHRRRSPGHTADSLLIADLRWLPPGQRASLHLSAPGGPFGFAKPAVGVLNSVAGIPVEWRAAQAAVHTAIVCALLAVAAFARYRGRPPALRCAQCRPGWRGRRPGQHAAR